MKMAQGPRPLSIKLFAATCLLAASVSLARGLIDPLETQGMLWSYTGMMLREELVTIALFSTFTIALIPIVWVYFLANPFARWLVVLFGVLRLWPYIINPGYVPYALRYNTFEMAAPALQLLAIILLFTPSAVRWFDKRQSDDVLEA